MNAKRGEEAKRIEALDLCRSLLIVRSGLYKDFGVQLSCVRNGAGPGPRSPIPGAIVPGPFQ